MNKERWIKWEPAKDLAKAHFVETIIDEMDRLIITLFESQGKNITFQLIFDDTVIAYRSVDEGFRLLVSENCIQDDGTDLWGQWTFFKARNSSYIYWLDEQSTAASSLSLINHFVIVAENVIIDIAAFNEPIINYVDLKA